MSVFPNTCAWEQEKRHRSYKEKRIDGKKYCRNIKQSPNGLTLARVSILTELLHLGLVNELPNETNIHTPITHPLPPGE